MKAYAAIVVIAIFAPIGCATVKYTPYGDAIYGGDVAAVRKMLDSGQSWDSPINDAAEPETPLVFAVQSGNVEMIKLLLDRGAPVNQGGKWNWTPLHSAAYNGHIEIIKLLLSRGAEISATLKGNPFHGETAEELARQNNHQSAADFLARAAQGLLVQPSPVTVPQAIASVGVVPAKARVQPQFDSNTAVDDYAVIIGIENYADLPSAAYAERDAAAYRQFVVAMGVPDRNIMTLTGARATKTGLEKALEAWLPNNVSEKSKVYFYYSGHGAPDIKTGDAYLVPADGDPQYLAQTGYPLKRLYAKLGELKAKSVLVALDSCFSGTGGRSVLAKGTRPLVGKVDTGAAPSKVSVMSASAGDQASGADDEAGYGLFTYNLLQGLNGAAKDASGQVTVRSLFSYLKPRVQDAARRSNRDQTPQLQGGDGLILRDR